MLYKQCRSKCCYHEVSSSKAYYSVCQTVGPVWAYSCFAFEGMNHTIMKMFHSTQDEVSINLDRLRLVNNSN